MTHWFGESWHAPINTICPHAPTPVGDLCGGCKTLIFEGDRGLLLPYVGEPGNPRQYVAFHLACFLDSVLPKSPA